MYEIYKPKSEILRKYISEFTILKKEGFKPINYLAFPHNNSSIVFISNATIKYNHPKITIDKTTKNTPTVIVLGKYLEPLHLFYLNAIDEIGINFTATGINYFFEENFDRIANQPFQFLKNQTWINFSKELYLQNEKERIDALENFFLSQLKKKELKKIEHLIDLLKNDLSTKVKDIATEMELSERTVNRLFHTYTGCSPSAYKKILRFRNSIWMKNKGISLTELSLDNDYYDSAHFTNEFKQLTSISPKKFFNNLSKISNMKFPYIFR